MRGGGLKKAENAEIGRRVGKAPDILAANGLWVVREEVDTIEARERAEGELLFGILRVGIKEKKDL